MPQVNLTLILDIEGRPLWKMSLPVRPETTLQMGDEQYTKAVEAAGHELARQIAAFKKRKADEQIADEQKQNS